MGRGSHNLPYTCTCISTSLMRQSCFGSINRSWKTARREIYQLMTLNFRHGSDTNVLTNIFQYSAYITQSHKNMNNGRINKSHLPKAENNKNEDNSKSSSFAITIGVKWYKQCFTEKIGFMQSYGIGISWH